MVPTIVSPYFHGSFGIFIITKTAHGPSGHDLPYLSSPYFHTRFINHFRPIGPGRPTYGQKPLILRFGIVLYESHHSILLRTVVLNDGAAKFFFCLQRHLISKACPSADDKTE